MPGADPEILLVGLDEVGASIGLALRQAGAPAQRIGHDPDGRLGRAALGIGAVDRLGPFPRSARRADVIVLSLPAADIPDALQAMASSLKPDTVVIDTTFSNSASVERARAAWPPGRHYVGAVPSLSASALATVTAPPRPDLFQGGLIGLVLPPGTPESVASLAFQFGRILGCSPFFLDASERDGIAASTEALPVLTAAALVQTASGAPNWHEAERLAGRTLGLAGSWLARQDPLSLAADLQANRANVLEKLAVLQLQLDKLRELIAMDPARPLAEYLTEARRNHEVWLHRRARGDWQVEERVPAAEQPAGGLLGRMFLPRRPDRRHGR